MFHAYCCKCLSRCCVRVVNVFKCFMFHVFFASVLETFFECFIYLQTYVSNILSAYFKSRSGVTHVAMAPVADG
jgi:hypothetical protein